MTDAEWQLYSSSVDSDFRELKEQYPFCTFLASLTAQHEVVRIRAIAANRDLIQETLAVQSDFLGEYSRELHIEVPVDYKTAGCKVYGAKWLDIRRFEKQDLHFFDLPKQYQHGYLMCVGLRESFPMMKNVILENVRTAENMLIAYERVMTGAATKLELIAYSHDAEVGKKQFRQNKARYIPKG